MRIEVAFTPAEHAMAALEERTAIVVDVLRASTTIVEALAAGASAVVPVAEVAEALALAGPGTVVGGERGGVRVEGFALGNSPREYTAEAVAGRRVVLCTTNGTRALAGAAGRGAARVLVGAFTNLKAVVEAVAADGRDVTVLCAGTEGAFSLEDAACAGAIAAALSYRRGDVAVRTDAAVAAEALFRANRDSLIRLLASGAHGRALVDLGFGGDIEVCAALNRRTVVPGLAAGEGGRVTLIGLGGPGRRG